MTNLITHKRKNRAYVWITIELFAKTDTSQNPYALKAIGENESIFYGEYETIDKALEAMETLRDEVKIGL